MPEWEINNHNKFPLSNMLVIWRHDLFFTQIFVGYANTNCLIMQMYFITDGTKESLTKCEANNFCIVFICCYLVIIGACLTRKHVYVAVWPSGHSAWIYWTFLKYNIIVANLHGNIRGGLPLFAAAAKLISATRPLSHSATRPRRHVSFLDNPFLVVGMLLVNKNSKLMK